MKAIVKKEANEGLWLEDVSVPEIGINEVPHKFKKMSSAKLHFPSLF